MAKVVLFSVVSVCVWVCLSVNTITPEPFDHEILRGGSKIWSKARTSSKMAARSVGGDSTFLMFC